MLGQVKNLPDAFARIEFLRHLVTFARELVTQLSGLRGGRALRALSAKALEVSRSLSQRGFPTSELLALLPAIP